MKFKEVWANALYANSILKVTSVILGFVTVILTFAIIRLGLRDPIVIERACFSKVVVPSKLSHTREEIESFVRSAVDCRFNPDCNESKALISTSEILNRNKEQDDLKNKNITQKIVVNSLKVDGNKVNVDADRILAAGKVKSIFTFPLQLDLVETERMASNPYGLLLGRVSLVKEGK